MCFCRHVKNTCLILYLAILSEHSYGSSIEEIKDDWQNLELCSLRWIVKSQEKQIAERDAIIADLRKQIYKLEDTQSKASLKELAPVDTVTCSKNFMSSISNIFTTNQLRLLEDSSLSYVHWNLEEKSRIIALHSVSSRAYDYLRDIIHLPLPHHRTVYRWLERARVQPDCLIKPVLAIIRENLQSETAINRICGISIDEMSIDPKYCYDPVQDIVYGGKKNVTVVTVRGIISSWK